MSVVAEAHDDHGIRVDASNALVTNAMVNKQLTRNLNGVETEVLLQYFADRVLVIVTQLGKVGCFVRLYITR